MHLIQLKAMTDTGNGACMVRQFSTGFGIVLNGYPFSCFQILFSLILTRGNSPLHYEMSMPIQLTAFWGIGV